MGVTSGRDMERKLSKVLSEEQAKLLKYWISKCEAGRLPARRQVSPADLIFCLSNISILEQKEGEGFVFRLTASNLKDVLGAECRGKSVAEECGNEVPWAEAVRRCLSTRAPVFGSTPVGHRRLHHWMRLPLEPSREGCQPVLCYDALRFDEAGDGPKRETMFVTADLIRRRLQSRQNAA